MATCRTGTSQHECSSRTLRIPLSAPSLGDRSTMKPLESGILGCGVIGPVHAEAISSRTLPPQDSSRASAARTSSAMPPEPSFASPPPRLRNQCAPTTRNVTRRGGRPRPPSLGVGNRRPSGTPHVRADEDCTEDVRPYEMSEFSWSKCHFMGLFRLCTPACP
jgi:hypothetical protein